MVRGLFAWTTPLTPLFLILPPMKLSQLIELLNKAHAQAGPDAEVLLCYEEGAINEGYEEKNTEGISDIRLVNNWPLPGKSLITYEGEIQQKVVIFYDNHYKLEPSDGISEETAAPAKKPELAVGQVWKNAKGELWRVKAKNYDEDSVVNCGHGPMPFKCYSSNEEYWWFNKD
jgi:hypothetical protein